MPEVLATPIDLSLFRPHLYGPRLPHLLPPAVFSFTRRVCRPFARRLLVAASIFHGLPPRSLATRLHALLGATIVLHARVYMVAAEQRHTTQLPGVDDV